ncbi:hypothetical protein ACVCL0_02910 [Rhodanobacter sp. UC4450_H17]
MHDRHRRDIQQQRQAEAREATRVTAQALRGVALAQRHAQGQHGFAGTDASQTQWRWRHAGATWRAGVRCGAQATQRAAATIADDLRIIFTSVIGPQQMAPAQHVDREQHDQDGRSPHQEAGLPGKRQLDHGPQSDRQRRQEGQRHDVSPPQQHRSDTGHHRQRGEQSHRGRLATPRSEDGRRQCDRRGCIQPQAGRSGPPDAGDAQAMRVDADQQQGGHHPLPEIGRAKAVDHHPVQPAMPTRDE